MPEDPFAETGNVVAGQVIVTLEPALHQVAQGVVPVGPPGEGEAADGFGVAAVDAALAAFGVHSVYRLHGDVEAADADPAVAASVSATYVVQMSPDADPDSVLQTLQALSGVLTAEHDRWWTVATRTGAYPDDPLFVNDWALARIRAPEAWDRYVGNASVVVAVIDTGVHLTHPDLAANLVAGRDLVNETAPPPAGFVLVGDATVQDSQPDDEFTHGTAMAGVIGAVGHNTVGVTGVAWEVSLMPIRVMHALRKTDTGDIVAAVAGTTVAAAIRWAAEHGAHVMSISLSGGERLDAVQQAVDFATGRDCLIVAAMGNESSSTAKFPAAHTGVFAVGAVNRADVHRPASNTGPHIAVVAPGEDLLTTLRDTTTGAAVFGTTEDTSGAAAMVAGAAALVRSCAPGKKASEVAQTLRATASPLGTPVPNPQFGSGIIDVKAAVDAVMPFGTHNLFSGPWGEDPTSVVPLVQRGAPCILAVTEGADKADASIYALPRGRSGPTLLWTEADGWSTGWGIFVPFQMSGRLHLLSYKPGSGSVSIDRIAANGAGLDLAVWASTWSKGWSHMLAIPLVSGDHLLSYKSTSGRVTLERLIGQPSGVAAGWNGHWSTGWDMMATFQNTFGWHILQWKSSTTGARIAIDRVAADGSTIQPMTAFDLPRAKDWSSIVPFQLNGKSLLLTYSVKTGVMTIEEPAADGQSIATMHSEQWSAGWRHIVPYWRHFEGPPHFFSRNEQDGRVDLDFIG